MAKNTLVSFVLTTLLVLSSGLFCASSHANVRFTHLLSEANHTGDGIGATTNIAQDKYGFIWIAGENGVLKYDGINITHFIHDPSQPSLTSNYTRNIVVDKKGVLWVGTDLGLCFHDTQIDNFRCFTQNRSNPTSLSDDTIFDIVVAKDNQLLVGTGDGLNILNTERTEFRRIFSESTSHKAHPLSNISSLMLDGDDLWIGTSNNGFGIYNLVTETLTLYPFIENSPNSVSFPHVRSFLKDRLGRIWIGTYGGGINRLNPDGKTFFSYRNDPADATSIGSDVIWKAFQDSNGNIWFATDHGGLAIYHEDSDSFTNYRHNPYDPNSLSSDQVRTIFEDSTGNLWIGTFPQGVSYINRSAQSFEHWSLEPANKNSLTHSAILCFLEDRDGQIWIGTENGLNRYNPKTAQFTHYLPKKGVEGYLQAGPILALEEDVNGDIWVGTWSGGLHRFNKGTETFQHYKSNKKDPKAIHDNFIWKLLVDSKNRLWIATESDGINLFNRNDNTFKHFKHDDSIASSIASNFVLNLLIDNHDQLWVASTNGLDRFDDEKQIFIHYKSFLTTGKIGPKQLDTVRFRSFVLDSKSRIWVGSQNNGIFVFDPETQQTDHLDLSSGLPSNYISSMVVDRLNQVWATTPSGVARIKMDELTNITVFTKRDGLAGNNYNRDATLLDSNGMIYLGGIDGVTRFYPEDVTNTLQYSPVRIHNLRILNQPIKPGDSKSPLDKPIIETTKLVLQHQHSMVTFEYVAVNFAAPNSFEYAYQLEGFDNSWNYVGSKRFATYTNLNQGKYTFRVKARPENGDWPNEETQIEITVLPPPWRTWWAYSLYSLALLALIYFLVRLQYKRIELISEKALNSELIRLNNIKDAFLANTSHELRTPLNGIIGIAESVYEEAQTQLNRELLHKLNLISLSGKRLSGLINDILDYTKLGRNKLKIYPKPVHLYQVTQDIFTLLQPLADEKQIRLINTIDESLPPVYADENRLQQIMLNLVGNGIKYTESGSVKVWAKPEAQFMQIFVIDTGIGIASDSQKNIFEAFQQVEENSAMSKGGTGLGLAVTKELVELHGGTIDVFSKEMKGSKFSFTIPIATNDQVVEQPERASHLEPALPEKRKPNRFFSSQTFRDVTAKSSPICAPPLNANLYQILIVDDDPVNRMVLSSMLQLHHYQIIEAKDGVDALDIITQSPVDLVILDIMMPKMSGFEVCRALRKTYPIYKLPILFLTAKKVDEDVALGFDVGANEFLTKPVSKYEILPRVANHIRLLQIYRNLGSSEPN